MTIFPYKMVKVTEGMHVKVSNHFYYSDFGARAAGEQRYTGRRFVMEDTPGTGFIERESDSHTYRQFVRKKIAVQRPRYWRLLLGKEPSFDRELQRVSTAMDHNSDPRKRLILESYQNALAIARTEERLQRIIRGIKDRIGHKSNKFFVSVLSHYKNKASHLSEDMRSVQLDVRSLCSPETYAAYVDMVDAFVQMANCRRIWHYNERVKSRFAQVYFDLGVFDFIHSETYLPLMRDSVGRHFYILPDSVIVAHSAVDFEVVPLAELSIIMQELSVEEPVEVLSTRLGDAASMIKIPRFDISFYFNHVRPIVHFIDALDRLKATL